MTQKNKKTKKSAPLSAEKAVKNRAKSAKKSAKNTPKRAKSVQKKRKDRSDSIEKNVKTAQAATIKLTPPKHINLIKTEMIFWDSIIGEFANVDWTDHTLEMAGMLARHMYALDYNQKKMKREGTVLKRYKVVNPIIDKETGAEIKPAEKIEISRYLNPRKAMIQMYSDLIIKFRRSLSMHARAQLGESRDIAKYRGASKAVQDAIKSDEDYDDDELLASPMTQQ
jgi:hypothetical protein